MRHFSIRRKMLAGAFLLGTVPLLLLALLLPPRMEKALLKSGEAKLVLSAQGMATLTQRMLVQHVETLQAIGRSEFLNLQIVAQNKQVALPENIQGLNRRLKGFMQAFEIPYEGLFVCDIHGMIFAGMTKAGEIAPYVHLDVKDREFFSRCRQTVSPAISGPIASKISGQPIVVVVVPLKGAQGEFLGLVGLALNADYISSLITRQPLGEGLKAFAIDHHGVIAAHAEPSEILKSNIAQLTDSDLLASRMRAGETGLESYSSPNGERRVAAFAPVPIVGWSIAATQSEREFTDEARQMKTEILILLAGCIVAAVVAALVFANSLTQPLRHAIKVVAHAGERVNRESSEIAVNATNLARTVALQARGIEVTSSAVSELAATTKSNSIRASAMAAIMRRTETKLVETQARVQQRLDQLQQAGGNTAQFAELRNTFSTATSLEFEDARDDSRKVTNLINEIAAASREQANASQTVSETIGRFEQGVHAGAATAQQSAAAAELLKAQVVEILKQTSQLQQLIDGSIPPSKPTS